MLEAIIVSNLTCGIICAKWALDLGFSQVRQVLLLIGGWLFGPLTLLILFVCTWSSRPEKKGSPVAG
jgi:hypothetical protein